MTLCVYALTGPQPLRPGARGISGERLRLVTAGSLGAVVGRLPRAPRAGVEALKRYDATVRRLDAQRPALLPARFGTCFDSLDELTFVLHSRQRSLRAALARVRHRTQMTVRVLSPAIQGPQPSSRSPGTTEPRTSNPGTGYLRARAAAAARERDIPGFDSVQDAVRRWVRAERVEQRSGVASVYHLVPRGSAEAYRRAAEQAAVGAGLRIVVRGPWPPYAFSSA